MRPKRGIVLTERDLAILQFVFEHRVVSCRQVAKKFFPSAIFAAAFARLEKLVTAKFLMKSSTIWNRKLTTIYGVTEKGIKAFRDNFSYQITKFNYKSDSVNHDLGLVTLRERLETKKMVKGYYSESMLNNCSDLFEDENFKEFTNINADAALEIETNINQFKVALEYEISTKTEAFYVKKLKDYYYSQTIALVLYVCGNAKIERFVRAADLAIGTKHKVKVFTCLEDNLYKSDESFSFCNRNNAIFKLV